jgi:hypothetical protein
LPLQAPRICFCRASNLAVITGLVQTEISYAEFYGGKSKPITDEIDHVLARHYGFTDEELDFIINYDIKYRMGKEEEKDEG